MSTREPGFVDPSRPPGRGVDLSRFMAAVREAETGNPAGDYTKTGAQTRGYRGLGAYQISQQNWDIWSKEAGIPGANWRSPAAQDLVASTVMNRLFRRYGNWELVAAAWFGGPQSADNMAQRGYAGTEGISNRYISKYVKNVAALLDSKTTEPFFNRYQPTGNYESNAQWLHPIAGESEWSKGSWMPNTLTHRGRTHAATDIYAAAGTPIVAPVSGKVIGAATGKIGGNYVRLQGDDGNIYYFAHMKDTAKVSSGQRVSAGAHIGFVGTSGSAQGTSPHLHFSIKRGSMPVNPATMLEGARAGGGSFSMDPEVPKMNTGEGGMGGMLSTWVQTLSNTVAGGQRQDPRELVSLEEEIAEDESAPSESAQLNEMRN